MVRSNNAPERERSRGRVHRFIRRHGDGRPLAKDCAPMLVNLSEAFAKVVAAVAAELANKKGRSAGEAEVQEAVEQLLNVPASRPVATQSTTRSDRQA